jgi:hypothetical protein
MADSVGSGFPSTGINKGHTFYDLDEQALWMYIGGIPRLASSWKLISGKFNIQPDTSLWGLDQAGAQWVLVPNKTYYGWDGTQIVEFTNLFSSITIEGKSIVLFDDFMGGLTTSGNIGNLGWSSSGGSVSYLLGESDHPGILRKTSSTIGTVCLLKLYQATGAIKIPISCICALCIRVETLIGADVRFGVANNGWIDNPVGAGVYFEKLSADTTWFIVVKDFTTGETRVDTGIVVSTVFTSFKIQQTPTTAYFWINGVSVGVIQRVPEPGTGFSVGSHIVSITGGSEAMNFDYIYFQMTELSR